MDAQEQRLARSREAVANLSHALKTPLAAVTQVMRGSRPIDRERRRKILTRLEDMHAQLDAELRRSRIADPGTGQHTDVGREARRLIEMFRSLYPDKHFLLDGDAAEAAVLCLERQDVTEMLGIVLDNAGKWARHEVRCRLAVNDALVIRVEDDGPGVPEADLARLGRRGLRLDRSMPGHDGLGLAILRQLVVHYGGEVAFHPAVPRGLVVTLTIPCP